MRTHLLLLVPLLSSCTDAFTPSNRYNAFNYCVRNAVLNIETGSDECIHPTANFLQHTSSESQSDLNSGEKSFLSTEDAEKLYGMPWDTTIGNSEYDNPLLYMPFWEWQLNFMKSSLSNLVVDTSGRDKFGMKINDKKKARMVNLCFKSDEYRKIRMTYYDAGDNTQVFNSLWYPHLHHNLPVLGIDLLAFNRKKYLAIVDFQPLHEVELDHAATYEHRLKPIKDSYNSLKGKMSSKFYDETQFFSKQILFSRFDDESIINKELFPAFQSYVRTHKKLISETMPDESIDGCNLVLERQRAYDLYSAERDPATGLFTAMFGKVWAEDFVHNFLFSLSEVSENHEERD